MSAHLLDACALLWWMADAPELGGRARRAIANQRNEIIISAASLWEIAIKRRKGRLTGVELGVLGARKVRSRLAVLALLAAKKCPIKDQG